MADRIFWQTSLLYIHRPNLINRRVIGAKLIRFWICPSDHNLNDIVAILNGETSITIKHLNSIFQANNSFHANNILDQLLMLNQLVLVLRKLFLKQSLKSLTTECENGKQSNSTEYDWVILAPLLNTFAILPVVFGANCDLDDVDHDENSGHEHINIRKDDISFTLTWMIDGRLDQLKLGYLFDQQQKQDQTSRKNRTDYWLENVFKPKFERWLKGSLIASNHAIGSSQNDENTTTFEGSIRNISVESYCHNYNRLKEKYVSSLMNIWYNVEKTDPIKYIYEDVAIAAYLITLWQEEMEKFSLNQRQTFIDIGCGNGLLVYILTNEGYHGYGVDVRKRNIWQHYGDNIKLIEMTIDLFNPNDDFKLDQCDWMIGNHSDELTPWIIYMAAQTSPYTRAFILPCCCFHFDGFKFQRTTEPNKSQYQCYIDFLHRLCHQFGFKCFRDKLRIPSTKRICLVCHDRTYLDNGNLFQQRNLLYSKEANGQQRTSITLDNRIRSIETEWQHRRRQIVQESLKSRPSHRRLRERDETVRNCTRIDQNIKQEIINRLAKRLLKAKYGSLTFQEAMHLLLNEDGDDGQNNNNSNSGDLRQHLKNQCGGLQTFIRNHKHIFTIEDNRIRFQRKEYLQKRKQNTETKTKECWFHRNHPQGCPVQNNNNNNDKDQEQNECAFRH